MATKDKQSAYDLLNLGGAYNLVDSSIVLPAGSAIQILSVNPKRWGALIGGDGAGIVRLWPFGNVSNTLGFLMNAQLVLFQTLVKDHANLTQGNWFAFAGAGATLSIIEIVLP